MYLAEGFYCELLFTVSSSQHWGQQYATFLTYFFNFLMLF